MELPGGTHLYTFTVDGKWTLDTTIDCGAKGTTYGSDDDSTSDSESEVVSGSPRGEATAKLILFFPQAAKNNVQKHIKDCGYKDNMVSCRINPNGSSAVVTMRPASIEVNALSTLNGSLVSGKHKLTVQKYRRKRQDGPKKTHQKTKVDYSKTSAGSENCRVFVGSKLPPYTNEQHIREHFKKFSERIVSVDLIRDKHTKQFQGFGFVQFSSASSAQAAIRDLNHTTLLGVRIRVAHETSKEKSSTSLPGGGPAMTNASSVGRGKQPSFSKDGKFNSPHLPSVGGMTISSKSSPVTYGQGCLTPTQSLPLQAQFSIGASISHQGTGPSGARLHQPSHPNVSALQISKPSAPTKKKTAPKSTAAPKATDRGNYVKIMELGGMEWNSLMMVQVGNKSKYMDIMEPFKSNPNVTVTPEYEEMKIRFAGERDAVESAYGFLKKNLEK